MFRVIMENLREFCEYYNLSEALIQLAKGKESQFGNVVILAGGLEDKENGKEENTNVYET